MRGAPRYVRVFLSSPSDVVAERNAAREVLARLAREPLVRGRFILDAVSWDDPDAPVPMLAGTTPQGSVYATLPTVSECDLTIVILWARMGTPQQQSRADGTRYLSGTELEYEEALAAGKPVLVYRRTGPPPGVTQDRDKAEEQQQRVARFFERFEEADGTAVGGYTTYETVDDFRTRLHKDLQSFIATLALPEPEGAGTWPGRVRQWRRSRLGLLWLVGATVTLVSSVAVQSFADAMATAPGEPPLLAYVLKYVLLSLAVAAPLLLLGLTWVWLGGRRLAR
jgi:hypothetical protein